MLHSLRDVFAAVLLAAPLLACDDATTDPSGLEEAGGEAPWTTQFTLGNFAVNTVPVVTNQDGISEAYCNDYVESAKLPNANLEAFSVNAYLPTSAGYDVSVTSRGIRVARTDSSRTDDIAQSMEYVQDASVDGTDYSVFKLVGITAASPAITAATFANVTFDFTVSYSQGGSVVKSVDRTIEVYKR